jgi:hypothetical protein
MPRSTRNAAFDSEFGHRLQVLLEQYLKLSVAQLTETLGYESSATIRRALSGKGALDLAKLRTLAAINTQEGSRPNLDWLITGIGSPLLDMSGVGVETCAIPISDWSRWLTKDRRKAILALCQGPQPPK